MNIKTVLIETDGIVPIHTDLFIGNEDRQTKHVFKVKEDDEQFLEYLEERLNESDIDWELSESENDDEKELSIYERL